MAYFPESRAGEIWSQALGGIAGSISQSLQFYRKRHDEITANEAELHTLAGMTDVDGRPVVDPKALERILAHSDKEKYGIETGMLQGLKLGTELQRAHAQINKSILSDTSPGTGGYLFDKLGNPYAQWNPHTRTWVSMPQSKQGPVEGSVKALTSRVNKMFAGGGFTTDEFLQRENEEPGYAPLDTSGKPDLSKFQSGKELEKAKADVTPDKYNAVRFTIDGNKKVAAKDDFNAAIKMHPRKGDPTYQEVKVGQPQPGTTSTIKYPVGTKWKRGNTWYIMTDQGWRPQQQPSGPPQNVEIGAGDEDADNE